MFSRKNRIGTILLACAIVFAFTATSSVVDPTNSHARAKEDSGPFIHPGDGDDIGGFKEPNVHEQDGEFQPPIALAGRAQILTFNIVWINGKLPLFVWIFSGLEIDR